MSTDPNNGAAQEWEAKLAHRADEPWSELIGRCGGCTRERRACRFGILREWRDGDRLLATVRLTWDHEGGSGVAHGGVVASIMDEVLGPVPWSLGHFSVTKSLTVEYLRPVPIGDQLDVSAAAVSSAEGRWRVEGTVTLGSTVLARAHGVWVERKVEHYRRFQRWIDGVDRPQ